MRRQFLFYLSAVFFCVGCSSTNIESRIVKKVKNCSDKICTVDISDFTDFDWDTLFVFNATVSPEIIQKAVGSSGFELIEDIRPWVFKKNGKIVHVENNEGDFETVLKDEVLFNYPDSLEYQSYLRGQSLFKVIKRNNGKFPYYELYPIKRAIE